MSVYIKKIDGSVILQIFWSSYFEIQKAVKHGISFDFADLRGKWLQEADLIGASLQCADLRGAVCVCTDLRGSDLRGAHLDEADFHGADFHGCIQHKPVQILKMDPLDVVILDEYIVIGCQTHRIEQWAEFSDEQIESMHWAAPEFWLKNKDRILSAAMNRSVAA